MNRALFIIDRFGGVSALARLLGHRNPTTVEGWKTRGVIPARRQQEILDAAKAAGVSLAPADFFTDEAAPASHPGGTADRGRRADRPSPLGEAPVPTSRLIEGVALLERARALVVGDVMLDRFVYGGVERVSPEAPIPVLRVERESVMLGGAGNVVRNLVALGASAVFLTVVGDDPAGAEVRALMAAEEGLEAIVLEEKGRPTTIKNRYIAEGQQLLRADRGTEALIDPALGEALVSRAREALASATVVVLSDYAKGVLGRERIGRLVEAARREGKAVVVDPKGRDYSVYRGATAMTPNRKELALATGLPTETDDEVAGAARRILDDCGLQAVLATRGKDGMTLVGAADRVHHLRTEAKEVFDVSGAGDTVAATLAAGLGAGLPLLDAATLANVAAGIVVGKVGTAVAYRDDLVAALHHRDLAAGEAKVLAPAPALDRIAGWRARGLRIGFTNGCFDLLHPGHVSLLAQGRAACDRLVVGLNSDASVARLKGAGRPVQPESARAAVLASLALVDLVVLFAEDTPMRLIRAIRPDVLVKGADYTMDRVVGADFVEGYGGRVLLADLAPGYSTTATVAKIAG